MNYGEGGSPFEPVAVRPLRPCSGDVLIADRPGIARASRADFGAPAEIQHRAGEQESRGAGEREQRRNARARELANTGHHPNPSPLAPRLSPLASRPRSSAHFNFNSIDFNGPKAPPARQCPLQLAARPRPRECEHPSVIADIY
jgi:hypothetical protein